MKAEHGLRAIGRPEAQPYGVSQAPATRNQADVHRHLWAIGPLEVPYALEECPFGQSLRRGMIKHTNLTGGGDAHCGGEAWFLSDDVVVINGRSGRYGPSSNEQLRAAGQALRACGYKVASMGFDEETGEPASIVVGQEDLEWL